MFEFEIFSSVSLIIVMFWHKVTITHMYMMYTENMTSFLTFLPYVYLPKIYIQITAEHYRVYSFG